jgi:VWFA-related protein
MKFRRTLWIRLRARSSPAFVLGCLVSVSSMHSLAQPAKDSQDKPPAIIVNVNRVLIPVVVRDKQGRAVGDLKKEDFQVFDKEKPQPISGFTIERRGTTEIQTGSNAGSGKQLVNTPSSASVQSTTAPQRFIVFLFDDMHLTAEDLAHAQKAGVKMLTAALDDSDMAAVVSISGRTNSGLIRDRAKLQEATMSLKKQGLYQADGAACPNIDYHQADLIENKHDSTALQDAVQQILVCDPKTPNPVAESLAHSSANRVLALGDQDVQATYASITEFVRRMAAYRGNGR